MMANNQQFGFQADAPVQQAPQQEFGFEEEKPTQQPKKAAAQQVPLTEQIENLLATPGETLLEAGQTLSRLVQGLPGAQSLARGIVGILPESARRGLASLQVRGDILPEATIPAKIGGELLGGATAVGLGGEVVAPALEALPGGATVTSLAERFPRIARTAGTGVFGFLTSPESRARGATLGAALGLGGEAIAGAPQIARFSLGKAKSLFSGFAPEMEAQNTLKGLSGGQNLEENSKSLATLIRDKFEALIAKSKDNFDAVLNNVGQKEITAPKTLAEANEAMEEFTPNLKKVFNKFKEKPTFENAHNLRVDLGDEIGMPVLTRADRSAQQAFRNVRNTLKEEMNNFLENSTEAGNTSNPYQQAIDFHREEVVPYKSNTALRKVATGEIKNPRNITTIFKSPEGEEEAQNYTKTLKVLNDIGSEGERRILFNELGKSKNAKDLVSRFNRLDQQRLGSFVNPELRGTIEGIDTKLARKEIGQRAIGGLTGATLGSLSGFPIAGTTSGATLGATVLPALLRGLTRRTLQEGGRKMLPQVSIAPETMQRLARIARIALALRGGQ